MFQRCRLLNADTVRSEVDTSFIIQKSYTASNAVFTLTKYVSDVAKFSLIDCVTDYEFLSRDAL